MDELTTNDQDVTALDSLEATAKSVQQNASILRPQSPQRTISQPLNDTLENTKNGIMDVPLEGMTQNVRSNLNVGCIHRLTYGDYISFETWLRR